jgi:hypothetical protein
MTDVMIRIRQLHRAGMKNQAANTSTALICGDRA